MANTANPSYNVNTAPYVTQRHLGALATIMDRTWRFCSFVPIAEINLPCGVFVTLENDGSGTNLARQLAATEEKIFGVSYFNTQRLLVWNTAISAYEYQAGDFVTLIEEGDIFMFAETSVDIGDPVYTRFAADAALDRIGALSNAAGIGLVEVSGAKFTVRTTAPGQVVVSLPDII